MANEKCCCNCLHCARWQTSKGVQCHCDLDDKYLGYLTVMDVENDCKHWEKETKWDIEKEHDKEVYNKAIDDFKAECHKQISKNHEKYGFNQRDLVNLDCAEIDMIAEQLKGGVDNG